MINSPIMARETWPDCLSADKHASQHKEVFDGLNMRIKTYAYKKSTEIAQRQ